MKNIDKKINILLKKPFSFYNWNELNNFIYNNKNVLTQKQKLLLIDKSEKYRQYHNKNFKNTIEKNDIAPNIYV